MAITIWSCHDGSDSINNNSNGNNINKNNNNNNNNKNRNRNNNNFWYAERRPAGTEGQKASGTVSSSGRSCLELMPFRFFCVVFLPGGGSQFGTRAEGITQR